MLRTTIFNYVTEDTQSKFTPVCWYIWDVLKSPLNRGRQQKIPRQQQSPAKNVIMLLSQRVFLWIRCKIFPTIPVSYWVVLKVMQYQGPTATSSHAHAFCFVESIMSSCVEVLAYIELRVEVTGRWELRTFDFDPIRIHVNDSQNWAYPWAITSFHLGTLCLGHEIPNSACCLPYIGRKPRDHVHLYCGNATQQSVPSTLKYHA